MIIVCHLFLLGHTLYQQWTKRNEEDFVRVRVMRILYITLQIWAILFVLNGAFRYAIDPHTHLLRDTIGCRFMAFASYYFPGTYFGLYLFQISLRLENSFKGSYLALNQNTLYILRGLILLIPVTAIWSITVDLMTDSEGDLDCIMEWHPSDLNQVVRYCTVPIDDMKYTKPALWGCLLLINGLNCNFGAIFTLKLQRFVKNDIANQGIGTPRDQFNFEALIIKNQILTMMGIVSTISAYALYSILPPGQNITLYVDNLLNCLVIGLMFRCNRLYYKRLCRPCIMCCFRECDPYQKAKDKAKFAQRTKTYVLNEHTATETMSHVVELPPIIAAPSTPFDSEGGNDITPFPESATTKTP